MNGDYWIKKALLKPTLFSLLISLVATTQLYAETQIPEERIAKLPAFPLLEEFDVILERPLFDAQRKPAPLSTTASESNEQELRETWKLTGITITNEKVMALFQERNGDKRPRLEAGMPLDEHWLLEEIAPMWVDVSSGDLLIRLHLRQPRESMPSENSRGNTDSNDEATENQAPETNSVAPQSNINPAPASATNGSKAQTM